MNREHRQYSRRPDSKPPHKLEGQKVSRVEEMEPAIIELMARWQLGHFEPRIRTRLGEIFEHNPPDATERLARAAQYVGIDGTAAEYWTRELIATRTAQA